MDENKIPHKNGLSIPTEKNFFAASAPMVPHKPDVPRKPGDRVISQDTPPKPPVAEMLASTDIPQKNDVRVPAEKPPSVQKLTKPFENASGDLSPLRTYRQDVAGVMRDKKTSLVQMVLEEQRGRNKREQEISPTSRKNLPLVLLSFFFLLAAVGIIYYLYFYSNPADRAFEELKVTPLIFIEKTKEIAVDGKDQAALKEEVASALRDTDIKVDSIEYLFFTETLSAQTADGIIQIKNLIPANRFFGILGVKMPPPLLRSLRPDFMFGFHAFNRNQPFFILKTDYYDSAFAGMLEWEKELAGNLLPLFSRADRVAELSQRPWGDTVIKNKDTRTLRNFDGSIAIVYTFKDQRTLIIATSEDALLEVSRRLDLAQEKRPE